MLYVTHGSPEGKSRRGRGWRNPSPKGGDPAFLSHGTPRDVRVQGPHKVLRQLRVRERRTVRRGTATKRRSSTKPR